MFFSSFSSSNEKTSNQNTKKKEDGLDLQHATEVDRRALLEMACEHDRVDILQSVLQVSVPEEEDKAEDGSVSPRSPAGRPRVSFDLALLNCPPKELLVVACNGSSPVVELEQEDNAKGITLQEPDYSEDEEMSDDEDSNHGNDEERHQPPIFFVPPLHIAVASGSTHATTALLRIGADPSVTPIFTQNISLSDLGPIAKFTRCKGAYELLTVCRPNNLSPSVIEKLKHAFTAEALRAIGSDESERIQQLISGGMPPTEKVGDLSLYEWAVELKAVKCQQLLRIEEHFAGANETEEVDTTGEIQQELDVSLQTSGESSTIAPILAVAEKKGVVLEVSDDKMISGGRKQVSPLEFLHIQLEEQQNLVVTLSACLDRFLEESSIYKAVFFADSESKSFSKAGLLQKVKQLKASKAKLTLELQYYEKQWKAAEEDMIYLEEEIRSFCLQQSIDMSLDDFEIFDDAAIINLEDSSTEFSKNDDRASANAASQLFACQDKVRKLRASIADLGEENARNHAEIENLGLGGTVRLAKTMLEELHEVEYGVSKAKAAEAYCRGRIDMLVKMHEKATARISDEVANAESATYTSGGRKDAKEERNVTMTHRDSLSLVDDNEQMVSEVHDDKVDVEGNALVTEYDLPPEELFDKLAGEEKVVSLADLLTHWVELREMLDDQDLYHDELQEIYSRIPKAFSDSSDKIDRAGFIALYREIESLFEDIENLNEQEEENSSKSNAVYTQESVQLTKNSDESGSNEDSKAMVASTDPVSKRVHVDVWELLRRMVGLGRKPVKKYKHGNRENDRKVMIVMIV